ncbi:hypothetical protein LJ655_05935 [Paraburkholderia sp. MMS20-SJTN17]|uniref:Uncharacterized protein n=1 Tax=Paraburkholderia translucens TaxID=2886945 RepID=A0ABS8K9L4_9BURK|nr:hypothetical protein [Paraburkholderia sp. MMS20-SJTN17]MCC8401437.1 hypothetical protein [Paraburkholderia sp. MMS20-SJTN17]
MANIPERRRVVVMWSEDKQALVSYTLDAEKVQAVTERFFPLELPLADYNNALYDEFAKQFGAATLNLLALSNPDMKPFVKTTPAEDSPCRGTPSGRQ